MSWTEVEIVFGCLAIGAVLGWLGGWIEAKVYAWRVRRFWRKGRGLR